jgi:predicted kinase
MMSAPSASGKSTLARQMMEKDPNLVRINRDELRSMMLNKWRPSAEGLIIESEISLARLAGEHKRNIVIDDTNLMPKDESRWKTIADELGYSFEKKVLTVSLEECIERDYRRIGKGNIGPAAIERQFLRAKLWKVPPDKKTVIFDIDGTIADLEHRIPWITIGAKCPAL